MKNKINDYLTILLIGMVFLFSTACKSEIKFDKNKWLQKDDIVYPYRYQMLKDLTHNYQLIGIKYSDLITLLGIPEITDAQRVKYIIEEKYGSDIDPIYTKYLTINISKDSAISSYSIEENKY
jgi:hypothetical protein